MEYNVNISPAEHTHALTCGVCGVEALALHRGIGDEAQVNPVARGDEGLGKLAAAEPAQNGHLVRVAVKRLQVIVGAFLVLLDLELVKRLRETQGRTAKRHQRTAGPCN